MNKLDREFGALLRDKREKFHLTQMELARKLKWPQTTVSRVEKGRRSVSLSELRSVSVVFQCSANELFVELEMRVTGSPEEKEPAPAEQSSFSAAFNVALENEDVALSQLS